MMGQHSIPTAKPVPEVKSIGLSKSSQICHEASERLCSAFIWDVH
ncbi:hypothetical protein CKAH01_17429 [Colletotrichum kahawae]|uniref:Uncharacterized protein n=1 Tax=Colletotrichum kahawae TaxID=34407 RepID=A0AAE0D3N0_COLKA|nr:hypothetical protein CKAH01_17429 [Colletotrichum kahawae]